jgi:hypothetical protein
MSELSSFSRNLSIKMHPVCSYLADVGGALADLDAAGARRDAGGLEVGTVLGGGLPAADGD